MTSQILDVVTVVLVPKAKFKVAVSDVALPMSIYICCPVFVPHIVGILWPVFVCNRSDYVMVKFRGGVKLEFVRNSFDSIRKLTNRLIRKGKKSSKKFDNFQFELHSIGKKIIRKIRKFFKFSFLIQKI